MSSGSQGNAEKLANEFVGYLFEQYQGSRHVRRVATWIGFLLKAVERASGGAVGKNRSRQITFEYGGKKFKARYDHQAGSRGGIEILEVLPGRGSPDGGTVAVLKDLSDAETVYLSLEHLLDSYMKTGSQSL